MRPIHAELCDTQRHRAAVGAALSLLLMGAVACGSDESDTDPVVMALAAEFDEDEPNEVAYTAEESDCMARAVVDEIEVTRLAELGITATAVADFDDEPFTGTREEAEVFAAALGTCVGFDALLERVATSTNGDPGCLTDRFTPDQARQFAVEDLLRSPEGAPLLDTYTAAVVLCSPDLLDQSVAQWQERLGGTPDEARCTVTAWIDEIGATALALADDGGMTPDQATLAVGLIEGCYGSLGRFYAARDATITAERAECLVGAGLDDPLRELIISDLTGTEPSPVATAALLDADAGCA